MAFRKSHKPSLINIPNKKLGNFINRGGEMGEIELLTPAKIAERWGISVDKLKKSWRLRTSSRNQKKASAYTTISQNLIK
jgi:hypothetical protein